MPSINRIRVNNIKYNFGTQCYDDFSMRMYGKNTLYDLANGGGKSVLMLLLMQNMIPNCTLDEKQPIEKLFRNGGGNTSIHSLIEWKLDDCDVEEGFRYMTTGFCARKAKDRQEGGPERTTASVEYFNYCIFYRDYNANDIINLPLSKNKERMTYEGLRSYLKDLGRKNFNVKVEIFDRKGEYQRFISRYGLYESQWEIIRGINKTEGHVRTYFENNYKTTRKVVEDLLIEEIIEKAFQVKTANDTVSDDMARNLLDIKDKLMELSEKKRDILNYDRQRELINVLESRVSSFLDLYEKKDRYTKTLSNIYITTETLTKEHEEKTKSLLHNLELKRKAKDDKKKNLEELKVLIKQYKLNAMKQEANDTELYLIEIEKNLEEMTKDLALKESMNDYCDYVADRQSLLEAQSMIQAAQGRSGADMKKLHTLVYNRKQRDDKMIKMLQDKLDYEKDKLSVASEKENRLLSEKEEATISLAIVRDNMKRLQETARDYMEEISEIGNRLGVFAIGDIHELIVDNEEKEEEAKNALAELEKLHKEHQDQYYEAFYSVEKLEKMLLEKREELDILSDRIDIYLKNKERLENMMKVYCVEEKEDLFHCIRERSIKGVLELSKKMQDLAASKKKLDRLEDHRIIGESKAADSLKDYLLSRHGVMGVFGMDYLSAQTDEVRETLMERFPLLPYGVVVDQFEELVLDRGLMTLDLGDEIVPLFNKSLLLSTKDLPQVDNDVMVMISKQKDQFIKTSEIEKEIDNCKIDITEQEADIARLTELQEIYEEDMEYAAIFKDGMFVDEEKKIENLKAEVLDIEKRIKEHQIVLKDLELAFEQDDDKQKEQQAILTICKEDAVALARLSQLSKLADKEEASLKGYREEERRLTATMDKIENAVTVWTKGRLEAENKIASFNITLRDSIAKWDEVYKPYYEPGTYETLSLSDAALEAEVKAQIKLVKNQTILLDDKKKLVETLEVGIKRIEKNIEKRGVSMHQLSKMQESHNLYQVKDVQLKQISDAIEQLTANHRKNKTKHNEKINEISRLEGSIEQNIKSIEEKYGSYMPMKVSLEEAEQAVREADRTLRNLENAFMDAKNQCEQYERSHGIVVDLYKDVKRVVDTAEIDYESGMLLHISVSELQKEFDDSLVGYDRMNKMLGKAKNELLNFKSKTADNLHEMGAYELSDTVRNDVEVPSNYQEAMALRDNLNSMAAYIKLEKERVEKGLEDMEFIKNNFESQCIQRCHDVKTELDKLPKLSRIQLDGEMIQVVGLSIPYVKEEFVKQRMSEYIERVVKGADSYEEADDRMKYIRNCLALKKLFSVIVTDMNAIKLSLYKRERIKEQSRYLRYEEAVGSTGQSQGIYIQFLVAITNYISGMYSPNMETSALKKVIFIDNPFGAAKDIYIWEPIFALLKTNQVQLIVPARGATPAITARFDVNYILGQQVVGNKQQTVVVDYRSQIEQDEIEYQDLSYDQESFDFI